MLPKPAIFASGPVCPIRHELNMMMPGFTLRKDS